MIVFKTIAAFLLSGVVTAQYPPTPTGLTTINSKILPGVNITYKEVPVSICLEDPKDQLIFLWPNL